jgi:hypothetical protein
MRFRRLITGSVLFALAATACREDDSIGPGAGGTRAHVTSDPPGARIRVDDRNTNQVTPDTIRGLNGQHDITVVLVDSLDTTYGYNARIDFPGTDTTFDIHGPLLLRCFEPLCYREVFRYRAGNRVRFATNPAGAIFLEDGTGGMGLLWPGTTSNTYVSGGFPVVAGMMLGDTVALGAYDTNYFAGRPAPTVSEGEDSIAVEQTAWVLPPSTLLQLRTVRGIRIDQHLIATARVEDVVVMRLVFTNITAEPLYQTVDPVVAATGATLSAGYIGFVLDPDIGTPTDDAASYDPELDMVFAYDARFEELNFGGGFNRRPALIGMRVLDSPPGTNVVLSAWIGQLTDVSMDWRAGQSEGIGWLNLSGTQPFQPVHADPRIGHLPPSPGDIRLSATAGPLVLAPGDSAAITIAIVLAEPAADSYDSGLTLDPGDPTDVTRRLYTVAANLRERALAAEALMASFR